MIILLKYEMEKKKNHTLMPTLEENRGILYHKSGLYA